MRILCDRCRFPTAISFDIRFQLDRKLCALQVFRFSCFIAGDLDDLECLCLYTLLHGLIDRDGRRRLALIGKFDIIFRLIQRIAFAWLDLLEIICSQVQIIDGCLAFLIDRQLSDQGVFLINNCLIGRIQDGLSGIQAILRTDQGRIALCALTGDTVDLFDADGTTHTLIDTAHFDLLFVLGDRDRILRIIQDVSIRCDDLFDIVAAKAQVIARCITVCQGREPCDLLVIVCIIDRIDGTGDLLAAVLIRLADQHPSFLPVVSGSEGGRLVCLDGDRMDRGIQHQMIRHCGLLHIICIRC